MNNLSFFGTTIYDGAETSDIFHNYSKYFKSIEERFILKEYYITGSPRPELLSYQLYDTPEHYWVLLMINDMYDPYYDWVMGEQSIHEYADQKYQYVGGVNKIAYHQTDQGERFWNVVEYPKGSGKWYDAMDDRHLYIQFDGAMEPITNIEHEIMSNDAKRTIYIVQQGDINQFVSELKKEMEKDCGINT